jgi:hypothetical protein
MDWQQVVSLIIVVATTGLLIRYEVRRKRKKNFGACTGCRCETPGDYRPDTRKESITRVHT